MAAENANSEETISAYFVFFSTLLAVVLILSKLLQDNVRLAAILPEAGMILGVGMVAGALVHWIFGEERLGEVRGMDMEENGDDDANVDVNALVNNVLSFSPNAFFVALLPPIIFNSGYHLRRELFFRHIQPIALLAVVGTVVSAFVIALILEAVKFAGWLGTSGAEGEEKFAPTLTELLTFGALISATDPVSTLAVFQVKRVDPQLFYLCFGESVINDAVGLVLFETFLKFVQRDNGAGEIAIGVVEFFVGFALDVVASPVLGWLSAILAALLFKHVDLRSNKLLELALFLLIMYVPFLIAEMVSLSGIVTILVTGIAARHYVEPNLSTSTQDVADVIFRLSAHLAETSIFLELGLSVVGVTEYLNWKFILWSLLACLLARACHVYPITYYFNLSLTRQEQQGDDNNRRHSAWNVIFGYNLKEGMDGIMRMDFGQGANSSANNNSNNNNGKTEEGGALKTKLRKPMSGNLELAEHLNDFSNHHPQQRSADENDVNEDGNNSSNNNNNQTAQIELEPEQLTRTESNVSAASVATLTPIPKRDLKIQPKTAHMLWFSGLRGAVAYACVRSFPDTFHHEREFTSTTMMLVLLTVFFMGGCTEAVLKWLNIEMNVDEEQYMEAWKHSAQAPTPGFFTYLDKRLIQRWVIRDYDGSASSSSIVGPVASKESTSSRGQSVTTQPKRTEALSSSSLSGLSNSGKSEPPPHPIREESMVTSSRDGAHPDIEMTESGHYDTLVEMSTGTPTRRKTSLFDYGLNKAD